MNPLKVIIGVFILGLCAVLVVSCDNNDPKALNNSVNGPTNNGTSVGDDLTDNEQLATLAALVQAQNEKQDGLMKEIEELRSKQNKNQPLSTQDNVAIENKIERVINERLGGVEETLLALKNNVHQLAGKEADQDNKLSNEDFGMSPNTTPTQLGGGSLPNIYKPISTSTQFTSVQQRQVGGWYVGDDVVIDDNGGVSTALSTEQIKSRNFGIHTFAQSAIKPAFDENEADPFTPFATIPQEATLTSAVTMSALLGRIPIGGTLVDPYEFKVLVGRENLAANGLYIPNLDRIVMRGVAKGDYTGQCASGDIISATFIFQDGRIQTINSSSINGGNSDYESAGTITQNRLGWISTKGGVPCISGEYITDAGKFIALQGGLAALGAAAEAYAASSEIITGTGDNRETTISDSGRYASGKAGSAAVNTTVNWINDIKDSAYAVIYIPTNQEVDIHIVKELRIDYHHKGRKISYGGNWNDNGYTKKMLD